VAALALAAAVLGSGCNDARPVETGAVTAADRCSACHGFPPPPFVMGGQTHPASTSCSLCHADTVDPGGNLIPGGPHLNGKVDVTSHPMPYVADHTGPALADLNACTLCHGTDYAGGASGVSCNACHSSFGFADWRTNCTFCHGTRTPGWTASSLPLAAPPRGAHGETLPSQPQVGAHRKHVGIGSTISDGVACTECHTVPADLAHLDGRVTLTFGALAQQGGLLPGYAAGSCSATYCHGTTLVGGANTTPSWTGTVSCGDCHGSPPLTGQHGFSVHVAQPCSRCHAQVATATALPGIQDLPAARALHVNGQKDVSLSVAGTWDGTAKTCSNVACHGTPGVRNW